VASVLAPTIIGTKQSAEAVGDSKISVEERSIFGEASSEEVGGKNGSENVGLSNENIGGNPMPR
jgi:hypothetical protein